LARIWTGIRSRCAGHGRRTLVCTHQTFRLSNGNRLSITRAHRSHSTVQQGVEPSRCIPSFVIVVVYYFYYYYLLYIYYGICILLRQVCYYKKYCGRSVRQMAVFQWDRRRRISYLSAVVY
jgi:hypothetical protein